MNDHFLVLILLCFVSSFSSFFTSCFFALLKGISSDPMKTFCVIFNSFLGYIFLKPSSQGLLGISNLMFLNSILTTFLLAIGVPSAFLLVILSLCLLIASSCFISFLRFFIFFSSITMAKEQCGVQVQPSVQEQPLHPPFRLKQVTFFVSRSMYLISTLKFSSSQTWVSQSLVVKNLISQPLMILGGAYSWAWGFSLSKQRLFQNQRLALPLNVSVNWLSTGFKPLMYFLSDPFTSKCYRLASFFSNFSQSSRFPAMWTFTMPQPPPARVQSKYFLQVFMTKAVEKILSNSPVLVKLHSNSSTTPFTVLALICLMTPLMKGYQSYKFLSVCTTSSFLPQCMTNACRSSQALSSTYLVNHSMIIIHTSSGLIFRSPCSMQALQKAMKKPLSAQLVNLVFYIQVKISVVYFSFHRSLPLQLLLGRLASFLANF